VSVASSQSPVASFGFQDLETGNRKLIIKIGRSIEDPVIVNILRVP
jgi:hypothetical protein